MPIRPPLPRPASTGGPTRSPQAVPPADLPHGSRGARRVIRWTVSAVLVAHGLLHLLGDGPGWTAAAVIVTTAAGLLAADVRWWWTVGAGGLLLSQVLIVGSWDAASAGTLANIVLAAAVAHGFASQGPTSLRARYRRLSTQTLAEATGVGASPLVTDADLAHLPDPVAAYVAGCGAVGRPRVHGFRARIHGRIRGGADDPWMVWTGEQANAVGANASRLLFMDATMKGLPTDVFHSFVGSDARMQVRPVSMLPLIDAHGADMTRAETVTLLNDLCVLAPAALVDAPIEWVPVDDTHARAVFTRGDHTVTATLVFDDHGDLVDFVSDDRLRSSTDGTSFTRQRWSTPLNGYRWLDGRRLATSGLARWHPPSPEQPFDYLEFEVDAVTYVCAPVSG